MSKVFDQNLNKYFPKKEEKNLDIIEDDVTYTFNSNMEIINSFIKVFDKHNIIYKPYKRSGHIKVSYLLDKLENTIPKNKYDIFNNELKRLRKLSYKIPIKYNEDDSANISKLEGSGLNNIKIDQKLLNKNILKIRYLNNNRKINNNLLNQDYKISNNMKNAIKFNIHKLSQNEMKIYNTIQKYINKDQDVNILIGSYLNGNQSKELFNKTNKILYNKYKNNLITQNEYTSLFK